MTKCKHSSSTVQADHGNVTLSECDWGCGAILITITGEDGIARTMTADEALAFSKMETTAEDLEMERQQIAAALGIKAEHYDLLDHVRATVDGLDERNEALEIVIAEKDALRAAYKVACEIFRSQAITLPRLRDAWNTAVQQVEAVGK